MPSGLRSNRSCRQQIVQPVGLPQPPGAGQDLFLDSLIRLVTIASWVDIEPIMDFEMSDATPRTRRDEWITAVVFDHLETEARAAYHRILELDLDVLALDGSLHKAPCGGEGTGPNPTDRAKIGWKWSVATDTSGIAIGWSIDGANRIDIKMLEPTMDAIEANGLLAEVATMTLDRSYDTQRFGASSTSAV